VTNIPRSSFTAAQMRSIRIQGREIMFDITDKLLAMLVSLLIFAQAYYIKSKVGTYIFPACLMSLAWFFFTIIPLTILFPVPINPISILYIFACISAFSLSSLPFNWSRAFEINKLKSRNDYAQFGSKLMRSIFYISSIFAIVFSTISVISSDINLYSLLFNLVETSGNYAMERGKGGTEYGVWGILGIFFTYATSILGGLVSPEHQKRIKKWAFSFVTFAPTVYVMLTQSSKLVAFYSIGGYLGAILLKKIYLNEFYLFNWRSLLRSVGFVLLMLPLLSISILSRNNYYLLEGSERLNILLFSINSYAFGQVYAFSDFFSYYIGARSQLTYINDLNSYGYWTFKSIFDMVGGDKYFPPTFFYDSYYHKEVVSTNIFTIFRSLINDFGAFGTICFMFVIGLITHALFYRLLVSRKAWAACSAFIVVVVFIFGTYLLSIFVARWSILLFVAFTIIFWINHKYCRKGMPVHP
jgi:oligosaccharide repeat unit polymerase